MRCGICEREVQSGFAEHRRWCQFASRPIDLDRLAMTNEAVALLTRPEREKRVHLLVAEARDLLYVAIREHILSDNRQVAAVVGLYSGGNDSTTLAHIFREKVTHFAHCNTTIGVEKTREFVRATCQGWGVPLLERKPPREADHYRALVLDQGFPGPGHHFKMFQRLKERALRQVQRELVSNPRRERVVFIAGRRRTESKRRANIPEMERRGSAVYVSPLVNWTKLDMVTYRLMQAAAGTPVPVNEVSDLIHMSGECMCGSFAHLGEREEVSYWFPEVFEEISALEAEIANREDIPAHRRKWGWGSDPSAKKNADATPSRVGLMCSSCDDRFATEVDTNDSREEVA